VTALAMENILYTLSAAAMIAAGMVALLFRFTLPPGIRDVSVISIAATLALFAIAFWLLWRQPALVSRALGRAFGRSPRGVQRAGPGTGRHARRAARDRAQGAHAVLGGGGSAVAGAARADADRSTIRIRHSLIAIRHSAFIIGIRHSAFIIGIRHSAFAIR